MHREVPYHTSSFAILDHSQMPSRFTGTSAFFFLLTHTPKHTHTQTPVFRSLVHSFYGLQTSFFCVPFVGVSSFRSAKYWKKSSIFIKLHGMIIRLRIVDNNVIGMVSQTSEGISSSFDTTTSYPSCTATGTTSSSQFVIDTHIRSTCACSRLAHSKSSSNDATYAVVCPRRKTIALYTYCASNGTSMIVHPYWNSTRNRTFPNKTHMTLSNSSLSNAPEWSSSILTKTEWHFSREMGLHAAGPAYIPNFKWMSNSPEYNSFSSMVPLESWSTVSNA
mmetsp:Transcript_28341/g.68943  ORF Transcript_28341/g.68943 Transcript_28341/m.68943 type:complete len:277 (+) Transcript_28341:62-892(+)